MTAMFKISNRAGASFPVRRVKFDFSQVPEYWANNSPAMTHFMTALSALFPAGEKLFIDSVRAVREHPAIKDNSDLQKEISAFIGQEAMHTHEHVGFNASAQRYGHDVEMLDRLTAEIIETCRVGFFKVVKPFGMTQEMVDLTATTALEHFTATIAEQLLTNRDLQNMMTDDTMAHMWYWHAIEENEHKAVVFDVYQQIFGTGVKSYALRIFAFMVAMGVLLPTHSYFTARLLKKDGKLNLKELATIYRYAYSPSRGLFTRMIKEMLMYFKPSFHPNDHDTHALLEQWKAKLGI